MGLFSNIKAVKEVEKIRSGGVAKLSISQVTNMIINLPDARKRLTSEEYEGVMALFNELQKCNTKLELNIDEYYGICIEIIKRFDKIAPYEKYSGGNEIEMGFAMDELRNTLEDSTSINTDSLGASLDLTSEEAQYAAYITEQANGYVNIEDARSFVKMLYSFTNDKNDVISKFGLFADDIIKKYSLVHAIGLISFFSGALSANEVITKDESDALAHKYIASLTKNVVADIEKKKRL